MPRTIRRTHFRTTTALVASLSLAIPNGLFLSAAQAQEESLFCLDFTAPPCPAGEPIDGSLLMTAEAAAAEAKAAAQAAAAAVQAEADAAAQAEADAAAQAETDAAAQAEVDAAAKAEADMAAQAEADAVAEADAAAQAEADAAAQAEADAAAQAEADAAAQAEADAAAQAEAEAAAQAEADAAAQAEADAAAQAAADAAAQAKADAAAEAAADAAAQVEADAAAQAEADIAAQAAADAAVQAEADAAARADADAQAQADADAAAQAETDAAAQAAMDAAAQADADAKAQAELEAAVRAQAETDPELRAALEAAMLAEAAAQAAANQDPTVELDPTVTDEPVAAVAAGAAETSAGSGAETDDPVDAPETVTETVEDIDVRTSDEDFPTAVDGSDRAEADTDDDLSDLEKILLLGLGAVVVGTVLSNGDEVVSNSGDRVVVRTEDGLTVYKDDDALLRQPGSTVETQTFDDGSTLTTLTYEDGSKVVTIRDSRGRVLRRSHVAPDGTSVQLFDDLAPSEPVDVTALSREYEAAETFDISDANDREIRAAMREALSYDPGRTFSLRQIREIEAVRALVPGIDLDTITFASGSAAIERRQARSLVGLGRQIERLLTNNPQEVFLIEGHTDAVGSDSYNLALSDRRAESVALALTENFDIPPENLIVQGYGEEFLKVDTQASEQSNRRASIRRITPLLRQGASD